MGLISTDPILSGGELTENEHGHRTSTILFRVTFDSVELGNEYMAAYVSGIPNYRAQHPVDTYAFLIGKTARWENYYKGAGSTYIVTCTYSTDVENVQFPWQERADISFEPIQEEDIFDKDKDGKVVVNSANDKFDPPAMTRAGMGMYRVVINQLSIDRSAFEAYRYATNDDTWNGHPKYSALNLPVQWRTQKGMFNNVKYEYFVVEYNVVINEKKLWHPRKILDAGYNAYAVNPKTGRLQKAKMFNDDLTEPTQPFLLNGSGRKGDATSPQYRQFREFDIKDFSALNITIPSNGQLGH